MSKRTDLVIKMDFTLYRKGQRIILNKMEKQKRSYHKQIKKILFLILMIVIGIGCFWGLSKADKNEFLSLKQEKRITEKYINEEGMTIKKRVLLPEGYRRVSYSSGSFEEYLRNYTLKPYGSPIVNYDGSMHYDQNWHEGILDIPVPSNGLQQCADALIRIRAEYLWHNNKKSTIGFNFTSGHYCSWEQYAEGYRPIIKGNSVTFSKKATPNHSQKNFYKYLNLIFAYSGSLSLFNELDKVAVKDVKIGDMLVTPGTPGHIEIVADEIVNEAGEKKYLLAQGYTPAQSVCLLKNKASVQQSPWYTFEEGTAVDTPGYVFKKVQFIRFR
ncbi:DUF4846 domain-containing protein [Aquimarina hainanensis]